MLAGGAEGHLRGSWNAGLDGGPAGQGLPACGFGIIQDAAGHIAILLENAEQQMLGINLARTGHGGLTPGVQYRPAGPFRIKLKHRSPFLRLSSHRRRGALCTPRHPRGLEGAAGAKAARRAPANTGWRKT